LAGNINGHTAQKSNMNTVDEIAIELSKTKLLLLITGAGAFVAIGLWMAMMDAAEIESMRHFNSPALVHGIGVIGIAFFGLCGIVAIKKFFDKKPGLVLSAAGVIDNASGVSAGFVPWSEITGFEIYEVVGQKMLVVKVVNPDKYVEKGSAVKRKLNSANFKMCGSPIVMTSNGLKIGFTKLLDVCNQYFAKYGKRT
jgi:hypothetical protein